MKKIFTLLTLLLFFALQIAAQHLEARSEGSTFIPIDSVLHRLQSKADSFLQTYKCCDASKRDVVCKDCPPYLVTNSRQVHPLQTVLPAALGIDANSAFHTVVLNNDNTINTGSAGAIVQDNNGGVLTANYAFQRKENKPFQLFNVGVMTETNGNIWDLYSASAWRSGLMLTLGLTHFSPKKGQQFDAAACEALYRKRRFFLNDLLIQYKLKLQTAAIRRNEIREIETLLKTSAEKDLLDTASLPEGGTLNLQQASRLQQKLDSLKEVQQQLDCLSGYTGRAAAYDSVLQNELTGFDRKNALQFIGYRMSWYSIKASIGNTRNKLFNDTLSTDNLPTYHLSDYTRLKISWDGNWLWNKKATVWLLKGEVNLSNRNFLQNKELSDLPYIEKDAAGKRYVYSSDNPTRYATLGSLKDLNTSIWVLYPSLYAVSFFAYNKCVGLEASAGYKFNLNKLQDVPDPNTYTLYGGLIFRVKKDEQLSKATISVNVGYYEAKKGRRAPDDFALRLKVAVPFNSVKKT